MDALNPPQGHYYEIDDKILPAVQLPAMLVELATHSRMDINELIRGTSIFHADLTCPEKTICHEQFYTLLRNGLKQDHTGEFPFRFGKRMPYVVHSALLQAILNAASIRDLLEIIRDNCRLYFPACYVELCSDDHFHYLFLHSALGVPALKNVAAQAFLSSIIALLKSAKIDTGALKIHLQGTAPLNPAPFHTYLCSDLIFDAPFTALSVPDTVWRDSLALPNESIKKSALATCQKAIIAQPKRYGFIEALHLYLSQNAIKNDIKLPDCASQFAMSNATFKRRLKKHGTSFQSELDNARRNHVLKMLIIEKLSNHEIAEALGINDRTNFRRAFKRWTGSLPNTIRNQLQDLR